MTSGRLDARWEARLDEVAGRAQYPPTPDLGDRVMASVRTEGGVARPALGFAPRFAVAAALALLVFVASIALPSTRTAIGEFFGLVEGERIEVVPVPTAGLGPTVPTATATAASVESFGTPYTVEEVRAAVGFTPALPGSAEPVAVYLVRYEGVQVAVLQYAEFDLWQTRDTGYGYFGKTVTLANVLETPAIGDQFGYWVGGGGHVVRFINADGNEVVGSERTIDRNTLIWRGASNVFYRLETSLDLEEAIAVAEGLP